MLDSTASPRIRTIEIRGRRYEIASITAKCHTITALHTGAVRQYRRLVDLNNFVIRLRWYLSYKDRMTASLAAD